VLLTSDASTLVQTGAWNTLGMRGTCSAAFTIDSEFTSDRVLPQPFAEICTETMVPYSHILWSACWLGIATAAVGRAVHFLRVRARDSQRPARGTVPAPDPRLADANVLLQQMRGQIERCAAAFDAESRDAGNGHDRPVHARGLSSAIELNALKVGSSELVVRVVALALEICGMAGYSADGPFSVERHLRDAYSAGCMIGNARLKATNATMLLLQRES
jgi:acyl-CoA dehydrogenase